MATKTLEYVQAVNEALREELDRDERVFLMGEDLTCLGSPYKTCEGLYTTYGTGRIRNTPISEIAICGVGLGAAVTGMRPVCELMYADFAACAMDQIANQIAKIKYMFGGKARVPLVIKTQQGGYVRQAAQHSASLEAWFVHTPGLKVVMPSCAADAKGLMKTAIRDDNPVIFIDHKELYNLPGPVPEGEYLTPFGRADIKREGGDVTVIATSLMVVKALAAAETLAKEGISVEVIDPRTLVPLDMEAMVASVKKTGRAVVVHEANRVCGIGAELAAQLAEEAFAWLDAPVGRVAALQCPVPYSQTLEDAMLPSENDIEAAVRRVMAY